MAAQVAWESVAELAGQYPRVLNEIMRRWQTAELDAYFSDLFFPSRPGRQGFPPSVMRDIFSLFKLHEAWKERDAYPACDVWDAEKVPRRVAENEEKLRARRLFQALEDGDEHALRTLLREGINLELTNGSGWTPLMVAAFMGRERAAALLIEAGARINGRDRRGYGPLHWAAMRGFDAVVDLLLRRGARAHQRSDKGITPLLQAASLGHRGIVRRLLKAGASVNERDDEGWTPLHKAVANDHRDTVALLLAMGANPNARHSGGDTPISIARQKHNKEVLTMLYAGAASQARDGASTRGLRLGERLSLA